MRCVVRGIFGRIGGAFHCRRSGSSDGPPRTGLTDSSATVTNPASNFEKLTYGQRQPPWVERLRAERVVAVIPASEQTGGKSSTVKIVKGHGRGNSDVERLQAPRDKSARTRTTCAISRRFGWRHDRPTTNFQHVHGIWHSRAACRCGQRYRLDTDRKVLHLKS